MKPVLVIYATRQGHTKHIAEHVGNTLATHEHLFVLMDAAHYLESFGLSKYSAAIVCASLHMGDYEHEVTRFVRRHLDELKKIPTVFLSVSLAEAGVEDSKAAPHRRAEAQEHVKRTIDDFLAETGWRPTHVAAVAGALMYSRYSFVTRFIMRHIAGRTGLPVDTTRNYEFTDWTKLDRLMEEFISTDIPLPADV
jgi:menaquinone-dependent protoporphyrinogen oxidase